MCFIVYICIFFFIFKKNNLTPESMKKLDLVFKILCSFVGLKLFELLICELLMMQPAFFAIGIVAWKRNHGFKFLHSFVGIFDSICE